ncbi:MAG: hypothetical protein C4324_03375 [Blastocatellia bacterium]
MKTTLRATAAIFALAFIVAGQDLATQKSAGTTDLAAYGIRIEPDKRLIVVLAAIDAARTVNDKGEPVPVISTPLSSAGREFRELLRSDLAALNEDLRQRISTFLLLHKRRNPSLSDAELVSSFISMAYALSPVPDLSDPVVTTDLPGNLLDVLDFAPLVRDFYRRSSISANLPEYVKLYQKEADSRLRASAAEMAAEMLGYLHTRPQLTIIERIKTETQKNKKTVLTNVEIRERERKFVIVPEMLAPVGTVNFVNVKDEYYVVIPPDSELQSSGVRRSFLNFVVDPILLSDGKDITTIRDQVKSILEERRKVDSKISPDVYLTISRSLVAAIDTREWEYSRLRAATDQARRKIATAKTEDEKRQVSTELRKFSDALADEAALRLSEDYEKGAVLSFYFYDQLKGVEESGFDIAAGMREMILSFDATKEAGRFERYAEARRRAQVARTERKSPAETSPSLIADPIVEALLEAEKALREKNTAAAEARLKKLQSEHPADPRLYYFLGRIASFSAENLSKPDEQRAKLLEAKVAYENVIRLAQKQPVDPALQSLAYVALARIYEFFDEKSYALALYEAALKLNDIPGGAYKEAMAAKARLKKEQ